MTTKSDDILDRVRGKVRELAAETSGKSASEIAIGDNDPLTKSGLIDSVGTIRLVLWIEQSFLTNGEEMDMTAANFGSINKIVAIITAAQEKARAKAA
jgi:acyl carrier protein